MGRWEHLFSRIKGKLGKTNLKHTLMLTNHIHLIYLRYHQPSNEMLKGIVICNKNWFTLYYLNFLNFAEDNLLYFLTQFTCSWIFLTYYWYFFTQLQNILFHSVTLFQHTKLNQMLPMAIQWGKSAAKWKGSWRQSKYIQVMGKLESVREITIYNQIDN